MAVLEIMKYPEAVLVKPAEPVETIDDEVRRLIDDMVETMYAAPGIGLAAPQVGVSRRIITVDAAAKEKSATLIVLINPEIKDAEGEVESEEGCLSLPDFKTTIRRAGKVRVEGMNARGGKISVTAEGLLAVALQHEIDHLNGTLILDRASFLKREFFKKRIRKFAKAG